MGCASVTLMSRRPQRQDCWARKTLSISCALGQGHVIVTHDDGFLILHNQGIPHVGMVYCHQHQRSIGYIVRALTTLWSRATPDEMVNRLEFL